ncbi:MAG: glycosyltransferase [Clostridiales bacterium]|nr:glycosyltransferase [Clostridiales bacterium]
MRGLINKYATDKFACSEQAGEYLYGAKEFKKHGMIIKNGIDTDIYKFNTETRRKKRDELKISDKFVVGHIGTLYRIKNQSYLIEIFAEILKSKNDSVLILAGENIDKDMLEEKAKGLCILDKILFLGQRNDVAELLQAYDVMIFPSLNEGLPIALIEAQASQLACLISNKISAEVKFNENTEFMPLEAPPEECAEKAIQLSSVPRENVNIDSLKSEYDINRVSDELDKIYNS